MKFLIRSKITLIIITASLSFFVGVGLSFITFKKNEKLIQDLEFAKLDGYAANTLMTSIESVETHKKFPLEGFVKCSIQDHYKRIGRKIMELENMPANYHGEELDNAISFLVERKSQIENFWASYGKFDCRSIDWKN